MIIKRLPTFVQSPKNKKAFTLVELSIVIVIIGLIVAGVVAGRSIVQQAKLRQVSNDINKIKMAVNTYNLKFSALPGDHTNATDYWGTAGGGCYSNTLGTTNTCNGNGNRHLAYVNSGDTSNVEHEPWHFWKHLANAKLWPGDFTGYSDIATCGTANHCMKPGKDTPEGGFSGTGWLVISLKTFVGTPWPGRAQNQGRNILAFTNPSNLGTHWWGSSLTPSQQYALDTKLDDGLPYQGRIVDMSGTDATHSPNCATANSDEFANNPPGTTTNNATYNLTYTSVDCKMFVDLE